MEKTIFITGATSGIGRASAELFAINGYRLILCGRRSDRLRELEEQLKVTTDIHTLAFDIRSREDVKKSIESLPIDWRNIDILINNAGNAHGLAPIQTGDMNDWDAMMDINVKGLLYITREILPLMLERKKGHIVNIGSIAGKEVYDGGNVYCASKAAVDSLTRAMRLDLVDQNIKVSAIHPGLVDTEFSLVRFKGDAEKAKNVYKGINPLKAEDIAQAIYYIISAPEHVNIADMLILPSAQASAGKIHRNN